MKKGRGLRRALHAMTLVDGFFSEIHAAANRSRLLPTSIT
jgi:hypothetical protein